ncbi:amidoligase family protein [uncultured Ruminococcus sp.]|uniref:amidoligase family protein n=1 Tax=uncultured Ruminococcus sp. TaxID=165186 RepID=UPI00262C3199|nr:amidoligase family protein [uncultured Ruminococcus sp.]
MEEKIYCSHCGAVIDTDDYEELDGQIICSDCIENYTTTCERCGAIIWNSDAYGDDYTTLCRHCYENYYTRCAECDALIHNDDAYEYGGEYYCSECYRDVRDRDSSIHEYNYKPEPIFYGDGNRYFGIELEIDGAGKDDEYAEELLDIANADSTYIYIKSDGSLDDGMELVSHPMTLDYHKDYHWSDIMRKAVSLGYRSHQTSTCGLHIHINRTAFSDNREEQDEVISRILYFVEHHWNEMLKFSRRSEYTMNRWAARYGYEHTPKAIMDKAKKGNNGRYAAVNLCNYHTVEFRMFRGTLKYNTFIAAIELVNRICDVAMYNTDESIAKISWSDFVTGITEPELITYLKERQLYINEKITTEEDM